MIGGDYWRCARQRPGSPCLEYKYRASSSIKPTIRVTILTLVTTERLCTRLSRYRGPAEAETGFQVFSSRVTVHAAECKSYK